MSSVLEAVFFFVVFGVAALAPRTSTGTTSGFWMNTSSAARVAGEIITMARNSDVIRALRII